MKAGSLFALAPAMLLAGVSLAGAQQVLPPPIPPPQPPATQLPPAPAALSVPDPFAGMRSGPRDLYRSPDGSDRFHHLSRYPAPPPAIFFPGVYVPGPYYYPGPYDPYFAPIPPIPETSMAETYRRSMAEQYLRRQREGAPGGLVLENVPANAQVFVDGYFVGMAEEFGPNGRAIELSAGAHTIELRAPGYDTLAFGVRIESNNILRYRGAMQTTGSKPAVSTAPAQATTARSFYVIPNCYAGDKPPSGTLPKGCDVKNLQTRK